MGVTLFIKVFTTNLFKFLFRDIASMIIESVAKPSFCLTNVRKVIALFTGYFVNYVLREAGHMTVYLIQK